MSPPPQEAVSTRVIVGWKTLRRLDHGCAHALVRPERPLAGRDVVEGQPRREAPVVGLGQADAVSLETGRRAGSAGLECSWARPPRWHRRGAMVAQRAAGLVEVARRAAGARTRCASTRSWVSGRTNGRSGHGPQARWSRDTPGRRRAERPARRNGPRRCTKAWHREKKVPYPGSPPVGEVPEEAKKVARTHRESLFERGLCRSCEMPLLDEEMAAGARSRGVGARRRPGRRRCGASRRSPRKRSRPSVHRSLLSRGEGPASTGDKSGPFLWHPCVSYRNGARRLGRAPR